VPWNLRDYQGGFKKFPMSAHSLKCPCCYHPLNAHISVEQGKEIVMYCGNRECDINGHERGVPKSNAQESYEAFVDRFRAWMTERDIAS